MCGGGNSSVCGLCGRGGGQEEENEKEAASIRRKQEPGKQETRTKDMGNKDEDE